MFQSRNDRLLELALQFAKALNRLLNQTVTDGVRLGAFVGLDNLARVGYQLSATRRKGLPVPLRFRGAKPVLDMWLLYTFDLDEVGKTLEPVKSLLELQLHDADRIVAYDFDRDSTNGYPVAHVHLNARSEAVDAVLRKAGQPKRRLSKWHVPVGGEFFPPSAAHVLELPIVEELVKARSGWQDAINRFNQMHYEQQLILVMRKMREVALAETNTWV